MASRAGYPTSWRAGSPRSPGSRFQSIPGIITGPDALPRRFPANDPRQLPGRWSPRRIARRYGRILRAAELAWRLLPGEVAFRTAPKAGGVDPTGWYGVDCPGGTFGPNYYNNAPWLLSCGADAVRAKASGAPSEGVDDIGPFYQTYPAEQYITHPDSPAHWLIPNTQGRWRKDKPGEGLVTLPGVPAIPYLPGPRVVTEPIIDVPPLTPDFTPRPLPYAVVPGRLPYPDWYPDERRHDGPRPVRLPRRLPEALPWPGAVIQPTETASSPTTRPGESPRLVVTPDGLTQIKSRPRHRRPPSRNVREKKVIANIRGGSVVGRVASGATELIDFVEAVYEALPEKIRKLAEGRRTWYGRKLDPLEKAEILWHNIDHLDVPQAIVNVIVEQIKDAAYGKLGKVGAQSLTKSGFKRPVGFQTGPLF